MASFNVEYPPLAVGSLFDTYSHFEAVFNQFLRMYEVKYKTKSSRYLANSAKFLNKDYNAALTYSELLTCCTGKSEQGEMCDSMLQLHLANERQKLRVKVFITEHNHPVSLRPEKGHRIQPVTQILSRLSLRLLNVSDEQYDELMTALNEMMVDGDGINVGDVVEENNAQPLLPLVVEHQQGELGEGLEKESAPDSDGEKSLQGDTALSRVERNKKPKPAQSEIHQSSETQQNGIRTRGRNSKDKTQTPERVKQRVHDATIQTIDDSESVLETVGCEEDAPSKADTKEKDTNGKRSKVIDKEGDLSHNTDRKVITLRKDDPAQKKSSSLEKRTLRSRTSAKPAPGIGGKETRSKKVAKDAKLSDIVDKKKRDKASTVEENCPEKKRPEQVKKNSKVTEIVNKKKRDKAATVEENRPEKKRKQDISAIPFSDLSDEDALQKILEWMKFPEMAIASIIAGEYKIKGTEFHTKKFNPALAQLKKFKPSWADLLCRRVSSPAILTSIIGAVEKMQAQGLSCPECEMNDEEAKKSGTVTCQSCLLMWHRDCVDVHVTKNWFCQKCCD
ncbi:hypothetical protein QAD02_017944 [Eretmocerus hayati]|uniref:Uncharacterized protein n=1 Tax=Eretmocerus hayati TaxID=131215 RepID=A0ACC2PIB2_9HYME|nr:hypothetical protein QAD02_017944 [Eretmocerus hayati]